MSRRKSIAERAGFGCKHYETTALALGVIVATSSDASTRIKCDKALKALRKLNKLIREVKK